MNIYNSHYKPMSLGKQNGMCIFACMSVNVCVPLQEVYTCVSCASQVIYDISVLYVQCTVSLNNHSVISSTDTPGTSAIRSAVTTSPSSSITTDHGINSTSRTAYMDADENDVFLPIPSSHPKTGTPRPFMRHGLPTVTTTPTAISADVMDNVSPCHSGKTTMSHEYIYIRLIRNVLACGCKFASDYVVHKVGVGFLLSYVKSMEI